MLQTLKNKLAIEYALFPIRIRQYTCRWKGHEYTSVMQWRITRPGYGVCTPQDRCKWCGKEANGYRY